MLGESLVYSFFTLRSHQWCKKCVKKEILQCRELNAYAQQASFFAIFLLNEITVLKFINNSHWKRDPRPLNEGIRSKLISRVFLLFDINIKKRRSPRNEVP